MNKKIKIFMHHQMEFIFMDCKEIYTIIYKNNYLKKL